MHEGKEHHRKFQSRLEGRKRRLLARLRHMWQWGLEDAETGGIGELSLYDQHPSDLGAELNARQIDFGLQKNMERMLEEVEKALQRIESGSYGRCENCGRSIDKERLEAMPHVSLCITCQEAADGAESPTPGRSNGFPTPGPGQRSFRSGPDGIDEGDAGDGSRTIRDGGRAGLGVPRQGMRMSPSDDYARESPGADRRPVEELSLEPPFGRTFRDDDDYAAYDGEDAWQDVARYGTANTPQDVPPAVDYDEVYVDADELRGVVSPVEAIQDLSNQGVSIPETYPDPDHEDDV